MARISFHLRGTASRLASLICLTGLSTMLLAQNSMVQVPVAGIAIGIPGSTYNATDGQPCTSTVPTYLDFHGDGCPGNQAILSYPYSLAVDPQDNIYVAEYTNYVIRVLYQGGSNLAAALIAANPRYTFTPIPGNVYPLGFGGTATTIKIALNGFYYCNGSGSVQGIAPTGPIALDTYGDGCPAQYGVFQPRTVALDRDGNIFTFSIGTTNPNIRIIYVGGTAAANLISNYTPGVVPQVGYIYAISKAGEFSGIRDIAIDSNEHVFVLDQGAVGTISGFEATTDGNQIKQFSGTGWRTYISGTPTASSTSALGDGQPATTSGLINFAYQMFFDRFDNLYIDDSGDNRVRVVYNAGTTPPLYVEGSNSTVVSNPVPGNIYTVAGGGTSSATGSLASAVKTGTPASIGLDRSGNLLFTDGNGNLWREDVQTGIATIIAGNGASSTVGSANSAPKTGAFCNGGSTGPTMTDSFGSGCPSTEVHPIGVSGRMVVDSQGSIYQCEQRVYGQPNGVVRKYSFTGQFGSQNVGTTQSVIIPFTPATVTSYSTPPTAVVSETGSTTSTDFSNAGSSVCSTTSGNQTCVYSVAFKPSLAGARLGSLTLSNGTTALVSSSLGGIGTGPQLTLDPAKATNVGTGFNIAGVAVNQANNVYFADKTSNSVYVSSAGAAPALLVGGFNSPRQLAVAGNGTVYVADSGNNRIASISAAKVVSSIFTTYGGTALSNPSGVAVDLAGNVYISDTGNNRILELTALNGTFQLGFSGLSSPMGISVDASGNVIVADSGNSRVVTLSPTGVQTSFQATPALFSPVGVSVDPAGNFYIADSSSQNIVQVPAGSTQSTELIGGIPGLTGLAVDSTGDVFYSATSLGGLAELNRTQSAFVFPDTNVGLTTNQVVNLSNTGNATLTLGATLATLTDATNFTITSTTTNSCTPNQPLTPGQLCTLQAIFEPQTKSAFSSNVTFTSNAIDAASLLLSGNGVQKIATTVSVTYTTTTGGLTLAGQPFTATAMITGSSGSIPVGGSAIFTVDGGSAQMVTVTNGVAVATLTAAFGTHTVQVRYSGDTNYTASVGSLAISTVAPAATVSTESVTPSALPLINTSFTVTSTVTSSLSQGAVTGTITFTVGSNTQTVSVNPATGSASATFQLPLGKYTVTAVYSGNSYYLTSTGTIPVQVIPNGTSSVALNITQPTGTPTLGQSITVAAAITTGNATATPTGTVTFTADNSAALSFTYPYAATLSATFAPFAAGIHTITASYSGDNQYAPGSKTITFTVTKITPTVVLNITPVIFGSGNYFTLTASVSSPLANATGTVVFSAGGSALATKTLTVGTAGAASTASYRTTTSVFTPFTFSLAYSGDSNFLPLTVSVTPTADFVPLISSSTLSVVQYATAVDYINISSFYNYTGSVKLTCEGLPANTLCRGTPSSVTLAANQNASIQLEVITNVSPLAVASGGISSLPRGRSILGTGITVLTLLGLLSVLPMGAARRKIAGCSLLFVLLLGALFSSGCSSDTRDNSTYLTPAGVYNVTVVTTDGTITHTFPMTLTVLPGTPYQQ